MISQKCIDLVKKFEGCRLTSYPDPGTGGTPWTIGYGHTGHEVVPGLTIPQEQADEWLELDLINANTLLNRVITRVLKQCQEDALTSFVYNLGIGAFKKSTLCSLVNSGKLVDASNEFLKWTRGGGKVLPGLVRRRQAEKALFDGEGHE